MATALLFPDTNFLAHSSRLLEIGKVLRASLGWRVVFVGGPPYLGLAADEGFETVPGFTVDRSVTLALARRAGLVNPFWWRRVVDLSIHSDLSAIRRCAPDVVVGDMHWSLGAAARMCGVPYVSVVNAAWTRYFAHPLRAFDGHPLTTILGPSVATRLLPQFKRLALWWWGLPYQIWNIRTRGRVRAGTLLDVIEGDLTLLADVPEFCPTIDLPPSVRYIGPVLWQPRCEPPAWLDDLDPHMPTIYLSLGSTGSAELLAAARKAFDRADFQVLVTTGGQGPGAEPVPRGWHVTDYAPGHLLMRVAHVSVNHGGNGTIYQALEAGIPIVGASSHVDQQVQMQLCERAGVGMGLSAQNLTPQALRSAVETVSIDRRYRDNARRFQAVLTNAGGADLGARLVHSFVHAGDAAGNGVTSGRAIPLSAGQA